MTIDIQPIQSISLKDACIRQLESLILAGKFAAGERLPSERDLAAQLGVSRPVLHQAIVALDAKGLVDIEPRRGVFVCDFRKDGSIPLLNTLMTHSEGEYQPELLSSLMAGRTLIEVETARLAAEYRTDQDLTDLKSLVDSGKALAPDDVTSLVEYDFAIHQRVAIASGNLIYPLLINSLKSVHTNLAGVFYRGSDPWLIDRVRSDHACLVDAIRVGDVETSGSVMRRLLAEGEEYLHQLLPQG